MSGYRSQLQSLAVDLVKLSGEVRRLAQVVGELQVELRRLRDGTPTSTLQPARSPTAPLGAGIRILDATADSASKK